MDNTWPHAGRPANCGGASSGSSTTDRASRTPPCRITERRRPFSTPCTALLLRRLSYILINGASADARNGGRVKFTCSTKDIASAVGAASKIVNAHTTVPILSNVLLTGDEGADSRARDRSRADARTSVPGRDAESGAVTVPAKLFSATSAICRPGLLELTGSPTRAVDQGRALELRFSRAPARRISAAAGRAKRRVVRACRPRSFREGVNATIFAASSEEARGAVLMGTLLELEGAAHHDGRDRRLSAGEMDIDARPAVRGQRPNTSSRRARWPKRRATSARRRCSRRRRWARRPISSC